MTCPYSSVGVTAAVSATLAATYDVAGFDALTWVGIGKLGSIPDLDGTYDTATFDDLSTGEEIKCVDMLRAGSGTFNVLMDDAEAGQTALEGAVGETVAMRFQLNPKSSQTNGKIYYRQAIVTSFKPTGISAGNLVQAEIGLEFMKTTVKKPAS